MDSDDKSDRSTKTSSKVVLRSNLRSASFFYRDRISGRKSHDSFTSRILQKLNSKVLGLVVTVSQPGSDRSTAP